MQHAADVRRAQRVAWICGHYAIPSIFPCHPAANADRRRGSRSCLRARPGPGTGSRRSSCRTADERAGIIFDSLQTLFQLRCVLKHSICFYWISSDNGDWFQGGVVPDEDELRERDWLDWVYTGIRAALLATVIYFYSTPERLLGVALFVLAMWALQGGWNNFRRVLQPNNNARPPPPANNVVVGEVRLVMASCKNELSCNVFCRTRTSRPPMRTLRAMEVDRKWWR